MAFTKIAQMLGLDQNTMAKLLDLGANLRDNLQCMVDELGALKRQQSYRLGRPRTDIEGYDPAALPGIYRVQPDVGKTETFDYRALLGKPATTGFIENLGTVDLEIVFVKANQGSDGTTKSNTLILRVDKTLPIDGAVDKIEVTTPSTAALPGDAQTKAR